MFGVVRIVVSLAVALGITASTVTMGEAGADPGEVISDPATSEPDTNRASMPSGAHAADGRVVWDARLRGMKLMTARRDGSDRKVLFQHSRWDADNIVVSPDDSRVAFSPGTKRGRSARLVVANLATGALRDVLPRRSEVLFVGPVGWSANGQRIVFQGYVDEPADGQFYPSYLYSVSSTGANLRKGRMVTNGTDNGAVFGSILVRGSSIIAPLDDTVVRYPSLRGGKAKIVARRAYDVRPTGDGQWLFYRHVDSAGRQSLSKVRPNGRDRQVVHRYRADLADLFLNYAPDTTGRFLLAVRVDPTPRADVRTVVVDTATWASEDLPFARGSITVGW